MQLAFDPGKLADIVRARIFAIACGYEDANDLDRLRTDPAFKLACGRLPDTGLDLCSQPTLSRIENLPDLRTIIRLSNVLVDLWLQSYQAPPASVTLVIDDTLDVVHGHQQLSLFNAHYDERCFLPIHIYDTATGRPVAVSCARERPRRAGRSVAKSGVWCGASAPAGQKTRILIRGDGHYGRPEVMDWCEQNGVDYVFGQPGNRVLDRLVGAAADDIRTRRALSQKPALRGYAETRYKARSWTIERRACARIEAATLGLDIHQPHARIGRAHL